MTVEVIGTAVGLLVIVLDNVYDPGVFTDDITAVLILLLTLLCGAFLSQSLYYRCCHTWSIINKPYYPCYSCHGSSICGSYREEIVEELDPKDEEIQMEEREQASLP